MPQKKLQKIIELIADYGQMVAYNTYRMCVVGQKNNLEVAETKKILVKGLCDLVDDFASVKELIQDHVDLCVSRADKLVQHEIDVAIPKIDFVIKKELAKIDTTIKMHVDTQIRMLFETKISMAALRAQEQDQEIKKLRERILRLEAKV